jgi:predicted nucleotidyltransferase
MPVRSLNSPVLKWPDRKAVDRAVQFWSAEQGRRLAELKCLGYFGSYARGDWGVGSDLDLIAVVDETTEPFERRALHWDLNDLPVPAEIIVYTVKEWTDLQKRGNRFSRTIDADIIWTYLRKA